MRIWSLHPKYLDYKGLVALWRETLLAKHVIEGKTKGYLNHPQLNRFKTLYNPIDGINQYLSEVYFEACNRNYKFDKQKINWDFNKIQIKLTKGQLNYEVLHFLNKLKKRDNKLYNELKNNENFEPHTIFELTEGPIESWEIVKTNY